MRPLCTFLVATLGSMLCGCGSAPAPRQLAAAAPAPSASEAAVSYDWHPLILVPFGTLLKESPVALHEVLLFHGADDAGGNEGKDCHAMDSAQPPQFAGRKVDDYLLCFDHDRLNRIEATLRLPAERAQSLFAAMCADWRKGAVPPAQPAAATAAIAAGDACEARDGATGVSGHLSVDAAPAATLVIALYSVAVP